MNTKNLDERLREAIRSCEYASVEELSRDSGIGIQTIEKFLAGGDMLLSDATQIVSCMDGALILPNDWLDMKQNLIAELDI